MNSLRIGRFLIKQWLGGGRFGDVYLATDTLLNKDFAIKVLRVTPSNLETLLEEARILKHILEVFDMDVQFTAAETFHQMKPDIDQVELVFLRPQDINPLNLQFFKTLHENKRIKIILVHDLFPAEDLGFIVAEVADAELCHRRPRCPGSLGMQRRGILNVDKGGVTLADLDGEFLRQHCLAKNQPI